MSNYYKLLDKTSKELKQFIERMIYATSTSEIVHNYAYEIVVKEQIVSELEVREVQLTETEVEMLLSKENTLNFLYESWMKSSNTGLKGTEYAIAEAVGR